MTSSRLAAPVPLLVALALAACDGAQPTPDASTPSPDAFVATDALVATDASTDAFSSVDAPAPSDAPTAAGTSVPMTYRTGTGTFDRAFMGYVSDTVGGPPRGLYVELSRGADDACPSETSPVPQQILTIDGFGSVTPGAQDTGLEVRFFDFEGIFREEIAPDTATAARVEITAIDLGAGTAEGTVSFTFADGSAAGTFRATHCASLDSPMP